ncbi:MAG TPA: hypothetical protein VFX48_09990, partial [Saprospiraceae bacterium]|nr:hypothetical protein [Saprospiraceae bacterium]
MFRIMFSNIRKQSLHVLAAFAFLSSLQAQTPTDGIMMKGKEICIAAVWSQDKWDEYWEGQ